MLLVAEEAAGINVLRRLADSGHRIVAVLTAPPTRGGGTSVESVARELGLPVLPAQQVRDATLAEWILDQQVDLLLNVHSLFVAHAEIVRAPMIGSFNLHPGPLPDRAGLNAPSHAIYDLERHHGVTVHWMEAGIDTGAIAYDRTFEIAENETGLSLSVKCVREGLPLVDQLLEDAGREPPAIPARPQDLSRRRYHGREVPQDGKIDWQRAARQIVAFVRACDYFPFPSPWGHPVARLDGQQIEILRAVCTGKAASAEPGAVGEIVDSAAVVAASDEWVAVERVRFAGAVDDAASVLRPGVRLESG